MKRHILSLTLILTLLTSSSTYAQKHKEQLLLNTYYKQVKEVETKKEETKRKQKEKELEIITKRNQFQERLNSLEKQRKRDTGLSLITPEDEMVFSDKREPRKVLNVTNIELQGNDNLCALYSTSALLKYLGVSEKKAIELLSIAEEAEVDFGGKIGRRSIINEGTYIQQWRHLLQEFNYDIYSITNKESSRLLPDWVIITRKYIERGVPVLAILDQSSGTTVTGNLTESHAILIKGYDDVNQEFIFYNPWFYDDQILTYDGHYQAKGNSYYLERVLPTIKNYEFEELKILLEQREFETNLLNNKEKLGKRKYMNSKIVKE